MANITKQIIINAQPGDVLNALMQREGLQKDKYVVKEFIYSVKELNEEFKSHMDIKEFKITHCKIVLEETP